MHSTDLKQKPLCLTVHIRTDSSHVQYSAAYVIVPCGDSSGVNSSEVILPAHQNDRYIISPGLLYLLPIDKQDCKLYRVSHGICDINDNNIFINCIYCSDMQMSTTLKTRLDVVKNAYTKMHAQSFQESPIDAFLQFKPRG